ncbi:MAG: S1C family serine protease [Dehalococcoidia bacterium]
MTTLASAAVLAGRFGDAAAEVSETLKQGVTVVRASGGGAGSGTVWKSDGLVITNNHVATGERAEVAFADGQVRQARVVARDPSVDLAALEVEADGLAALPAADSSALKVGQLVLAVGNPLGEARAVTAGIISGMGAGLAGDRLRLREVVQANITLMPGNSGGPLADAQGRVVGINAMVMGPGVALAVPANTVERFLAERAPGGPVLGVAGQAVDLPGMAEGGGVLISEVVSGSAAERAGLIIGDVLLSVDDAPARTGDELLRALTARRPGEPRRLEVLRGGLRREMTAVPRARGAVV